jgi:O-antigen ligase
MLLVTEQIFRSDPRRLRPLLVAFGASLVIPVVTGLGQLSGAGFVDESIDINRIHGSFVHPNALSTYAAIMLAYALALRTTFTGTARIAVYAAGTSAGFLLLYSYGRAAWIGGLVAVIVVGLLRDRRLLVAGAVGVLTIFLVVPSVTERLSDLDSEPRYEDVPPNSLAWRMEYWERVLDAAEGRPILGLGLDSIPLVMDEELQAHNSVVQAYAEMGLLGLVALLGFVVSTIVLVRRGLNRAPPGLPRDMMVGVAAAAASVLAQLLGPPTSPRSMGQSSFRYARVR